MGVRRPGETGFFGARMIWVTGLAFAIGLVGIMTIEAGPAQAKFKQPGCAKFKKKKRKAKNRTKKQIAAQKFRYCKANRKAYHRVKNSHFVGFNSDGDPINMVFCANGKVADDYGSQYQEIYKKGWHIVDARIRGKNFTATFEALIGVYKKPVRQVGTRAGYIGKKKGQWQIGGGDADYPFKEGDVKRTKARGICKKL